VRPVPGEIIILRLDNHPSQVSHKAIEWFADAQMLLQRSPPNVHEPIGKVEVSWSVDVPAVLAMLFAASLSHAHVYTAFLAREHADNHVVRPTSDGVAHSPFSLYHNIEKPTDDLRQFLVYGSPAAIFITMPATLLLLRNTAMVKFSSSALTLSLAATTRMLQCQLCLLRLLDSSTCPTASLLSSACLAPTGQPSAAFSPARQCCSTAMNLTASKTLTAVCLLLLSMLLRLPTLL
jgi:hypothetical protein